MYHELNQIIDQVGEKLVESVRQLVKIRSVESTARPGMPFGEGVDNALLVALSTAEELGLKTRNVDGYAGHVEIGQGEEIVGILCHLDVVPEGKNWTYPPYSAHVADGCVYGRGTIDNKGPAVAAIYALKAIQESGITLDRRVRLILGTDEESGWQGLNYYLEHEEIPVLAFSPDAQFPVIHGEKGILTFNLEADIINQEQGKHQIISIKGGNAPNMVPDYCEAHLLSEDITAIRKAIDGLNLESDFALELKTEGNTVIISSSGISAHGSLPGQGKNAISRLMVLLDQLELATGDMTDFIRFYNQKIGLEFLGESMGCSMEDELSGPLTFNVGMIDLKESKAVITVNIRYPVTAALEQVTKGVKRGLKGTKVEFVEGDHYMEPLYVPKDDPLVRKLMQVYREFTGDEREALTIGGGTYARAIDKAVAFGALFPGQPELAHQRDEYIEIDKLILNAKIYANAVVELAGIK